MGAWPFIAILAKVGTYPDKWALAMSKYLIIDCGRDHIAHVRVRVPGSGTVASCAKQWYRATSSSSLATFLASHRFL